MTADALLSRLDRTQKTGAGRWIARCPAHEDRSPSLSIRELDDEDAQSYLAAVVKGLTPPDPVRVGAARALLPFERARQRAPLKGPTPTQLDRRDAQAGEQELLDAWAEKAAAVRARLKKQTA